jgi:hypothetical protein
MKVTICFDEVKVIVPCGSSGSYSGSGGLSDIKTERTSVGSTSRACLKVSDVIENAIYRYKKATGKV